jgi:hypothetical protein
LVKDSKYDIRILAFDPASVFILSEVLRLKK